MVMVKYVLTALVLSMSSFFAAASPVAAARTPAAVRGLTGTIAFVVTSGGNDFIDTMNARGTDVRRLTYCGPGECYPSWSPNGREIAFQRSFDGVGIYVMNANGSDVRRLSPTPAADVRPSWSANGEEIIFSRVVGSVTAGGIPDTEIDVMNADGTDVRTILPADGTFNIEPRWSPTGSKVVFMSGRRHSQQIYTMNANGSDVTMITTQGANGDPSWSPNGARISFGSNRQGDGRTNIFTMSATGGGVRQLTHFAPPYEAGDTSWSPNGARIAFEVDRGGDGQSNPNVPATVWIINADGTKVVNTKVACAAVGCAPRWRPTSEEQSPLRFPPS